MTASEAADRLNSARNLLLKVERSDRMSKVDSETIRKARKDLETVAMYLHTFQLEPSA